MEILQFSLSSHALACTPSAFLITGTLKPLQQEVHRSSVIQIHPAVYNCFVTPQQRRTFCFLETGWLAHEQHLKCLLPICCLLLGLLIKLHKRFGKRPTVIVGFFCPIFWTAGPKQNNCWCRDMEESPKVSSVLGLNYTKALLLHCCHEL